MADVIQMDNWQQEKAAQLSRLPALACPTCETECPAVSQTVDGTTTYRCSGHGHRSLTWRIDADGSMLRGAVGRRFY